MDFKFFGTSPFKRFTQGKAFKPLKDSGTLPTPGGKYTMTGSKYHTGENDKYDTNVTKGCKFPTPRLKHNKSAPIHKSHTLPNMGKRCGGPIGICQTVPVKGSQSSDQVRLKVTLGESGLRRRWASKGNDLGNGKVYQHIYQHTCIYQHA